MAVRRFFAQQASSFSVHSGLSLPLVTDWSWAGETPSPSSTCTTRGGARLTERQVVGLRPSLVGVALDLDLQVLVNPFNHCAER